LEKMKRHGKTGPRMVEENRFDSVGLQEHLHKMIRTKLNPSGLPTKLRERQEQDLIYRLRYTGGGREVHSYGTSLSGRHSDADS